MGETENKAAARPKTAAGTADWEIIFEDPTNGLIPLVGQANSHKILSACMSVVIDKLFIRQHDEAERDRLIVLLDQLTRGSDDADVTAAREGVISLLRDIKTQRMTKAAQHIAMEHEAKLKDPDRARERRRASGRNWAPIILASVIGLAAVAMVAVLFVLSQGSGGSSHSLKAEVQAEQEQEKEIAAQVRANRIAEEKAKIAKAEADKIAAEEAEKIAAEEAAAHFPKNVYFDAVYWRGKDARKKPTANFYQPVFYIRDADRLKRFCGNVPWIKEAVNLALSRLPPGMAKAEPVERVRIGDWLNNRINKRLGKLTVLTTGFLAPGDPGYQSKAYRCRRSGPPPTPTGH